MLVKVIFPLNFVGATAAVASLGAGAKARIKNILDVAAVPSSLVDSLRASN